MKPLDFWGDPTGHKSLGLAGSSADQVGQLCVQVVDRLLTRRLNLVSGTMVGSITRPPLNSTFRGP